MQDDKNTPPEIEEASPIPAVPCKPRLTNFLLEIGGFSMVQDYFGNAGLAIGLNKTFLNMSHSLER